MPEGEYMVSLKKLTCLLARIGVLLTVSRAIGETASNSLWSKFETTRQKVPALHQEFEVEKHVNSGYAESVWRHRVLVDFSQSEWREQTVDGFTRLFDGKDLVVFESGGTEYTRTKKKGDKEQPLPEPYDTKLDWGKSKELQTLPCGFSKKDRTCVIVDVPIKAWVRLGTPGHMAKMTGGISRIMIDTETGTWVRCHTVQLVEGTHADSQWDVTYTLTQMSQRATSDATLFKLPDALREVREFTPWNEARIKKQLGGKPAPDLEAKDIHGNAISLADLRGKTVLLDFWTTWCPPCQTDAPSLEKLNHKYGNKSLAIIGISVNEARATVEQYLKKHPHSFPVVLSNENQLSRTYQIAIFPTYLIIGPDGTLMTAEQGDQGFAELRKELEKAGLEAE
jgi:thiol-disulfide isomerase/thioredoxin